MPDVVLSLEFSFFDSSAISFIIFVVISSAVISVCEVTVSFFENSVFINVEFFTPSDDVS